MWSPLFFYFIIPREAITILQPFFICIFFDRASLTPKCWASIGTFKCYEFSSPSKIMLVFLLLLFYLLISSWSSIGISMFFSLRAVKSGPLILSQTFIAPLITGSLFPLAASVLFYDVPLSLAFCLCGFRVFFRYIYGPIFLEAIFSLTPTISLPSTFSSPFLVAFSFLFLPTSFLGMSKPSTI